MVCIVLVVVREPLITAASYLAFSSVTAQLAVVLEEPALALMAGPMSKKEAVLRSRRGGYLSKTENLYT
tara:strand:+ start:177 stop:383 length:207 start_codon:yes stop_codon:yes gene_type:complete